MTAIAAFVCFTVGTILAVFAGLDDTPNVEDWLAWVLALYGAGLALVHLPGVIIQRRTPG